MIPQSIIEAHCQVSVDYREDLRKIAEDPAAHTVKVQFPFAALPVAPPVDAEKKAAMRKEQGKRLSELAKRKRQEKVRLCDFWYRNVLTVTQLAAKSAEDMDEEEDEDEVCVLVGRLPVFLNPICA